MKKINLFLLLVPTLLSGCITARQLKKQPPADIVGFSADQCSGTYANTQLPDTTLGKDKLWYTLYESFSRQPDTVTEITTETTVALLFTENLLTVTAMQDSLILNRFELRGKIKGDYFYVKRKLLLVPIPFIFFRQSERRAIIGMTENGNLVIKSGAEEFIWVFMAGGYSWRSYDEFQKLQ